MATSIDENGVTISIQGTIQAPKKNEMMFNSDMMFNRSVVLCALLAYKETGWCVSGEFPRCLDALGATGVAGLSWKKHIPEAHVTVNDALKLACDRIRENAESNNLQVETTMEDVSVLLHQRPFDFVFLDCYGSSVQYLDAAFRNIPKNGILVITSTDDAALYGKAADVTLRNYGGHIIKTFYAKELAARLVLSSVARSAAKCNKGIEVLCCVAVKSFITVIIRVIRGPPAANQCIRQVRRVLHCCMCEDRAFYPHSVYPIEQPYSLLSCDCRARSPGKLAVELGPVWCDEIYNPEFCAAMLSHSQSFTKLHKVTQLLQTIVSEAQCSSTHSLISGGDKENALRQDREKGRSDEKMDEGIQHSIELKENEEREEENRNVKKMKTDQESLRCPAFYFNLHRHCPKGYDLGKMSKIVEYLQSNGYKASRTHFDPEAIRTNATLSQLNAILLDFFAKSTQN